MRPHLVGSPCHKVQAALETALAEGALQLSPELAAHASRCARCGPEWRETESLLSRLHRAAAQVDLGPVPAVVDRVLAQPPRYQREPSHGLWVARQVAAAVAILLLAAGGLTWSLLKVNQALAGVEPGTVMTRLVAPLRDWTEARQRQSR